MHLMCFLHCIEVVCGVGVFRNLNLQKESKIVDGFYVATQLKYFFEVAKPSSAHDFVRLQPLMYPTLRRDARSWTLRTPTSYLSRPLIDWCDLRPFGGVCDSPAHGAGSTMFSHQAMQLSNLGGRLHVLGEAKYISIFHAAIGLDELATEPVDIWATKSVHRITPIPETHNIDREGFDVNRNCALRRNAKSQVKGGITWGDAANGLRPFIAATDIDLLPICPEECNEPYAFYKKKMSGTRH